MQDQLIDILAVVSGIVIIVVSTGIAIRTFMVPAGAPPLINRVLFRFTQALFDAVIRPIRSEARRQSVLSLFAPVSLLVVLVVLLGMIGFGYMLALYGAGIKPMIRAFLFSGSALSTLGFESPGNNFWVIVLSAVEALTVVIDRCAADRLSADHLLVLPAARAGGQQPRRADRRAARRHQGRRRLRQHLRTVATRGIVADVDRLVRRPRHLGIDPLRRALPPLLALGSLLDQRGGGDARRGRAGRLQRRSLHRSGGRPAGAPWFAGATPGPGAAPPALCGAAKVAAKPRSTSPSRSSRTPTITLQQSGLPMKPDKSAAWTTFAQHRVQYECPLMTLVRLKKPPRGARWTTDRDEAQLPLAIPLTGTTLVGSDAPKR